MSNISIHNVICPFCGRKQEVERYNSVNDYHKELFHKILDKSIFKYECEHCKEEVFDPQPFLFHKLGVVDIQIGYKITPLNISSQMAHPYILAYQIATGKKDVRESYDDIEEFITRIKDFV